MAEILSQGVNPRNGFGHLDVQPIGKDLQGQLVFR